MKEIGQLTYVPPAGEKLKLYERLEREIREKNFQIDEPFLMPQELQDPQEWKNFNHWKTLKTVLEEEIHGEYLELREEAQAQGRLIYFLKSYGRIEKAYSGVESENTASLEKFLQELRNLSLAE